MEEDYFDKLINKYEENNFIMRFNVYESAYKYTNICVWDYNNSVNVSNYYDFVFVFESVREERKNKNPNINFPRLIFESSEYAKIHRVIDAVECEDYREKLERLSTVVKNASRVLKKVDN